MEPVRYGIIGGLSAAVLRQASDNIGTRLRALIQGTIVIVYELSCGNDHRFEGWFASAGDFQEQTKSKFLICPLCGDERITRLPHASYVNKSSDAPTQPPTSTGKRPGGVPHQYSNLGAERLANAIEKVLESTEDVGRAFAEEARKIHYREVPERHIRGTASNKEVDALRDEGIEVVALPVPAHRLSRTH